MLHVDPLDRNGMSASSDHWPAPEEIQRLGERDRSAVRAHFVALPADDRRLRFGSTLATGTIVDYVEGIDFARDALLGLYDPNGRLIGVAHVALGDDDAELGISILPEHRRRGAGSALFSRAVAHARDCNVSKVYMHCLAENVAMMRIARRSGMKIVTALGDADAYLALSRPRASETAQECAPDPIALYDSALKANAQRPAKHPVPEPERSGRPAQTPTPSQADDPASQRIQHFVSHIPVLASGPRGDVKGMIGIRK
jgi:GNAT superfamily N-acetyltransferase